MDRLKVSQACKISHWHAQAREEIDGIEMLELGCLGRMNDPCRIYAIFLLNSVNRYSPIVSSGKSFSILCRSRAE